MFFALDPTALPEGIVTISPTLIFLNDAFMPTANLGIFGMRAIALDDHSRRRNSVGMNYEAPLL
ncbi:hypothetical protein M3699_25600 [Peribacillus simplex]|uniref:hypothetical protein n=1 Tax=Peribacillus simplex TaxID=1478 RepID=UPI00203D7037|nr:hypothetical protein [Peribacillus simplex]MCM3677102.1 hypothetical protein [Peribacillus simplex]